MNYFDNFPETNQENIKQNSIRESIRSLDVINAMIAEWLVRKEKEEDNLSSLLSHDRSHEGRLSYECDEYMVRITTGWNWSFDKMEYEIMKSHIPQCFNPVKQKIEYKLDKEILSDIEKYSSGDEKSMLIRIFKKKPSKMSIKLEMKTR